MNEYCAYESDAVYEEFFVGCNYFFLVYEAHQYIKPLSFNLVSKLVLKHTHTHNQHNMCIEFQ